MGLGEIQSKLWEAARQAAPRLTLIATGDQGGNLADLLQVRPLPDANVLYSGYNYFPFEFTHQRATWLSPYFLWLRAVPYPGTPERVQERLKANLASMPDDSTLRRHLQFPILRYGPEGWDSAHIFKDLQSAADWRRRHGVRVIAGEFGARASFAVPAERDAWLRDVRLAFERLGIGWAM